MHLTLCALIACMILRHAMLKKNIQKGPRDIASYYIIIVGNLWGENLHKFHNFTATYDSFLHEIYAHLCNQFNILQSAPFLSICESFLLKSTVQPSKRAKLFYFKI